MTTEPKKKIRYVLFFSILIVVLGSLSAVLYHPLVMFFDRQLNLNTWIIAFFFVVPFCVITGLIAALTWFKIEKVFPGLVPKDWVRRKGDTNNA